MMIVNYRTKKTMTNKQLQKHLLPRFIIKSLPRGTFHKSNSIIVYDKINHTIRKDNPYHLLRLPQHFKENRRSIRLFTPKQLQEKLSPRFTLKSYPQKLYTRVTITVYNKRNSVMKADTVHDLLRASKRIDKPSIKYLTVIQLRKKLLPRFILLSKPRAICMSTKIKVYDTQRFEIEIDIPHDLFREGNSIKRSYGEMDVQFYLNMYYIKYIYGHRIKVNGWSPQSYPHLDFYMPYLIYDDFNYNGTAIEFDGGQHFKPVRFRDNKTNIQIKREYLALELHDAITTLLCQYHHIKLIRIKNPQNYTGKKLKQLVQSTLDRQLLPIIRANRASGNTRAFTSAINSSRSAKSTKIASTKTNTSSIHTHPIHYVQNSLF